MEQLIDELEAEGMQAGSICIAFGDGYWNSLKSSHA
jgi:hypothetical protein